MAYLTLKDVNKIYPNGFHAVHDFNLEIEKGEFIVFVGSSGCGKSTTLRMIAGLEDISKGDFLIDGKRANEMGPRERAIIRKVGAFLMDEPLSNLDAKQRVTMRSEITQIHRETGATTIYVTHDQTEAMTMADRIVVMRDGRIQQVGTPYDLYFRPANVFVAGFIGEPPMNFVRGTVTKGCLRFGDALLDLNPVLGEGCAQYEGKPRCSASVPRPSVWASRRMPTTSAAPWS